MLTTPFWSKSSCSLKNIEECQIDKAFQSTWLEKLEASDDLRSLFYLPSSIKLKLLLP